MGTAIETAMREDAAPDIMRLRPPEDEGDMAMSRAERIGNRWRVRDDALWNPFEVISYILWIVFGFGFLLGGRNYEFAATLFLPVIVFAATVVLGQAALRWKAGEASVFGVMRDRIGLGA